MVNDDAEQERLKGFDDALEVLYLRARKLRQSLIDARTANRPAPGQVGDQYLELLRAVDLLETHRAELYGSRSGMTDRVDAERAEQDVNVQEVAR